VAAAVVSEAKVVEVGGAGAGGLLRVESRSGDRREREE
jgi:hypothetical protein